ncbi:MAG TPA: hypothetical protein VIY73_13405 [Polyangiaceae bacterium]
MPIRPEERARYPKDWPAISRRIRERAGQRCEWSGCSAPNGTVVLRLKTDPESWVADEGDIYASTEANDWYPVRIVLTVAHKDHTPEHCEDENLVALCQLHHLRMDAQHHAANARRTRLSRKACGDLFGGGRS